MEVVKEAIISLRSDRVRLLREKHGWSQRELARLCDFGIVQIHPYEAGTAEPTAASLRALAKVFGVTSDYLIGLSDEPYPVGSREHSDLDSDEQELLNSFRSDGWPGVMR